jgi:aconitate hydratase
VAGVLTDPRSLGDPVVVKMPDRFEIDDRMIIVPPKDGGSTEIRRGPNIIPLEPFPPLADTLSGEVLLKLADNVTTDHILPGGAEIMPFRSNIPAISRYCFSAVEKTFHDRVTAAGGGFVAGGANYGQGSSREHAAIAPRYLNITAILAKSYARIHRTNLINMGILPLVFRSDTDYEKIEQGDRIEMKDIYRGVDEGTMDIRITRSDGGSERLSVSLPLLAKEKQILKVGGALNLARMQ